MKTQTEEQRRQEEAYKAMQPELAVGEEYKFAYEYPTGEYKSTAKYLGEANNKHFFLDDKRNCLVLDKHWIFQYEDGSISHNPHSSAPPSILTREQLKSKDFAEEKLELLFLQNRENQEGKK